MPILATPKKSIYVHNQMDVLPPGYSQMVDATTQQFDQPGVGDVHQAPSAGSGGSNMAAARRAQQRTMPFLNKMYGHLAQMCGDGPITKEKFNEAMRKARGHAGGTAKAANRANLLAQMDENGAMGFPMGMGIGTGIGIGCGCPTCAGPVCTGCTGSSTTSDDDSGCCVGDSCNCDGCDDDAAGAIGDDDAVGMDPGDDDDDEPDRDADDLPGLEKADERVKYRAATAIGKQCAMCRFYCGNDDAGESNECVVVEGWIDPMAVCNLFAERKSGGTTAVSASEEPLRFNWTDWDAKHPGGNATASEAGISLKLPKGKSYLDGKHVHDALSGADHGDKVEWHDGRGQKKSGTYSHPHQAREGSAVQHEILAPDAPGGFHSLSKGSKLQSLKITHAPKNATEEAAVVETNEPMQFNWADWDAKEHKGSVPDKISTTARGAAVINDDHSTSFHPDDKPEGYGPGGKAEHSGGSLGGSGFVQARKTSDTTMKVSNYGAHLGDIHAESDGTYSAHPKDGEVSTGHQTPVHAMHAVYSGIPMHKSIKAEGQKMADEFVKSVMSKAHGETELNLADACALSPVAMAEGGEHAVTHPNGWALFTELPQDPQGFAEPPQWLNYLPRPGRYTSERYGPVIVTPERNRRFISNFKEAVYQRELPIDLEHETKLSGAAGWIREMRENPDGSVDARVDWTDRGRSAIEKDRFHYFSPEFYDAWKDPMKPEAGVFKDVAIGGGLTTRPFFKERALRSLVMSERGLTVREFTEDIEMADETTTTTPAAATTVAASEPAASMESRTFAEVLAAKEAEIESLRQMNEAQNQLSQQMSERIGALEVDRRRKRFTDMVRGQGEGNDGLRWFGEVESNVSMLETLADTLEGGEESPVFQSHVERMRGLSEQAKTAGLFSEVGISTEPPAGGTSAYDQLEGHAKSFVEAGRAKTLNEGISIAATEHPDLYKLWVDEKRKAANS